MVFATSNIALIPRVFFLTVSVAVQCLYLVINLLVFPSPVSCSVAKVTVGNTLTVLAESAFPRVRSADDTSLSRTRFLAVNAIH